jgi:DNA modification methylase
MIYNGNCLEVMRRIPDNTYSAIITDPPYAIDLLGKDWDKCIPDERYWKECLRVVKPGGFIFAFGGSRTFHRLCVKIEDSGWLIKDMFMWLYSSAMAKSHNISKSIDEYLGEEREDIIVPVAKARNGKASGGGKDHNQGSRPYIERAKRRGYHIMKSDKPVSTQAKDFHGYGTGFRPSHEPIIVAMKPLDANYHTNALKHGISGFDIHNNRIQSNNKSEKGRHPANVIIDPVIAHNLKRIANADRYFYVSKPNKKEKGYFNNHPSVKPLELMRYLIKILKQPNNQTYILDPFAGSGSTLVACEQLEIKCDGIELNKEYIDIIEKRIENIRSIKNNKRKKK